MLKRIRSTTPLNQSAVLSFVDAAFGIGEEGLGGSGDGPWMGEGDAILMHCSIGMNGKRDV